MVDLARFLDLFSTKDPAYISEGFTGVFFFRIRTDEIDPALYRFLFKLVFYNQTGKSIELAGGYIIYRIEVAGVLKAISATPKPQPKALPQLPALEEVYKAYMREKYAQFTAMVNVDTAKAKKRHFYVLDANFDIVYETDKPYIKGSYRPPVAKWVSKAGHKGSVTEMGESLLDIVHHVWLNFYLYYAKTYLWVSDDAGTNRTMQPQEYEQNPSSQAFMDFNADCKNYRGDVETRREALAKEIAASGKTLDPEQDKTGTDIRLFKF